MPARCRTALSVVCAALLLPPAASAQPPLKVYKSRHYDIHSDLPAAAVREAVLRSDLMVQEYAQRTRAFARQLTARLPLYLFQEPRDYFAAGAVAGSSGSFVVDRDGDARLLVLAGREPTDLTWRTMQHEGFHQFVYAVIGGDIPIWVNEGLAEYFGEAVFTGDDYLTGLVNPGRVQALQQLIQKDELRPLREMMQTSHEQWNHQLSGTNYLQAWSMVHFLAHAKPEYERAFNQYIREVSRGLKSETAWKNAFGDDVRGFERRWKDYWRSMSPRASESRYREAVVLTMTGYYARAASQQQRFETADDFFAAARAGTLRAHSDDWLPPSLLASTLPLADRVGRWSIDPRRDRALTCRTDDAVLTGRFELARGRVKPGSVKLSVAAPPARTGVAAP